MPAFHHISLLTKNRKKNIAFYTQLLGMRFVKNTVNQENTRMLHYYYGDYTGSPGSVVTFFIVPHLGQRYDHDHFLATIGLNIPADSLNYWYERLTNAGVAVTKQEKQLFFEDPDNVALILNEVTEGPLKPELQVQNDVPGDKQILGLASTQLHVSDITATTDFFKRYLDWTVEDDKIRLSTNEHLELYQTEINEKMRMGRGSIDHVAFAVKDDAALQVLYKRAQAQDWQIEEIISRGYFKSLYIREPGGNRLEFATMSPGFTIDEPLETLGESFALPPFLANKRSEIEANLYPVD
ncbi:VOC family protein [Enterococcus dispar]|jgi:catechol 2,3-dioxygenase-like lactoylglutathione lyase family enzyme|uniref:VOC family protein n=1 Tax=Enterococcus dispar TaxID=44009 RepID=UPI0018A09516|nr:VOC family protein [Enterococcus dispar]MCU7356921.1 VOC family protein [Enterococcus dispar]MDT2705023.1 VOC family protein [Enterococcus dispar]WCG32512.1 VOC family protein [Enterococcus dispar]